MTTPIEKRICFTLGIVGFVLGALGALIHESLILILFAATNAGLAAWHKP